MFKTVANLFSIPMTPVTSQWTHQAIFDTVAIHLFTQGCQATENESCLYRAPNGTKCAVGILIPDSAYTEDMEFQSAESIINDYEELEFLKPFSSLLSSLQNVHDSWNKQYWDSTEQMRLALEDVALYFELNPAILQELSFNDR
jgi:hypothetical protein